MNSYIKEIDNCFRCDAGRLSSICNGLYELVCVECGRRPIKIKKFGDIDIQIPDWCPRLKCTRNQKIISQKEYEEFLRYKQSCEDDGK